MKISINSFESLTQVNKQRRSIKFIFSLFLLFVLFSNEKILSQNTSGTYSAINDSINYWLLGGLVVIFCGLVIYVINFAISVLHENGRAFDFDFPIIRKMAHNERAVAIWIFIVVLLGIIWAVKFWA